MRMQLGPDTPASQRSWDTARTDPAEGEIRYVPYKGEEQLPYLMALIDNDLSEPYSIYTYRFFLHSWPDLCFLAMDGDKYIGVVISKLERHRSTTLRGYIGMLVVDNTYRKRGIGSTLVKLSIEAMKNKDADEVVLETELTNGGALRLYENLGFIRDKRLSRYYLNGVDAFRLKLWLKRQEDMHTCEETAEDDQAHHAEHEAASANQGYYDDALLDDDFEQQLRERFGV
ncbi:acyl-CoA N-acyltransferase [Polychytrium aggregatum]|uniref:acyl-CoA N-acyltransferase n=1 Tax=Polychytrium aggregatum TaxID=110093 RepID=UPI0022FDE286|nr:acyl-CoA N-acyltransferase [Polychytrium aggregatum]KAI9207978.1 acyl-CoA N-acyltransferase [Polychytrium aggregatum]